MPSRKPSKNPGHRGRETPGHWVTPGTGCAKMCFRLGEVSELVDEHDLGSCAERRGSSSLPFPTTGYSAIQCSGGPTTDIICHPVRLERYGMGIDSLTHRDDEA